MQMSALCLTINVLCCISNVLCWSEDQTISLLREIKLHISYRDIMSNSIRISLASKDDISLSLSGIPFEYYWWCSRKWQFEGSNLHSSRQCRKRWITLIKLRTFPTYDITKYSTLHLSADHNLKLNFLLAFY